MTPAAPRSFAAQLRALREAAGYTQEELATIAELSVHAVSALERGERRRPQVETVRALSAAFDLTGPARDAFVASARAPALQPAADEMSGVPPPIPLTALVGRDDELQTLRQWFSDPAVRLVTLVGPGGVGKTRLGIEVARGVAEGQGTRVVFAPVAAIRDPGLAACAVAEALGLADISASELPRRAHAACARCPTLLLLDNVEQLAGAATLVADLLSAATTLRLLVTSRASLRVRGEREFAVGPLALPPGSEALLPADLATVPAVRLFVERVGGVRPEFRLTPDEAPTVVAICRRLDALPLALELAAPWMKVLGAEGLRRRLERDFLLSTPGPVDLPARQQTLDATIAWSYQLLSTEGQRAFRRLGAVPGRFPAEAAVATLQARAGGPPGPDAIGILAELVDRSLLVRAETSIAGRPSFQMLETVRAYAARELAAAGEGDAAMEGLLHYCAAEATRAADEAAGPRQVEWLDRLHADLATYRAVLEWLLPQRRAEDACRIAWGLLTFWFIRGYAAEGLWWYQELLTLPSLPRAVESKALIGVAMMRYAQQQLTRARMPATRALEMAQSGGDAAAAALSRLLLGHVEYAAGDPSRATDHFTKGLAQFRSLSLPWGIGNALSGLAMVHLSTGRTSQAEGLLDEATSVLRPAGPWYLSIVLSIRAILALRRGDADAVMALVHEALTGVRHLHDTFVFVHALVPLAAAAALRGDDAWAARVLGARDAVTERAGVTAVDQAVRDLHQRVAREVHASLGPDRWALAYAAGRTHSVDMLLREIEGVQSCEATHR